jgi:hypothetical protein
MESRKTSADWKLLFAALLQREDLDLTIDVNSSSDRLMITTRDPSIALQLQASLSSPESLRASVNYTIAENKADLELNQLQKVIYPDHVLPTHDNGLDIFNDLFGEDTIAHVGRIDWQRGSTQENIYLLTAACTDKYAEIIEPQVSLYQNFLSSASFAELRAALSSEPGEKNPLPQHKKGQGLLTDHSTKIIYLNTDNDRKTIYFDYGLLIKCLTPPAIKVLEESDGEETTYHFSIDKQHWLNYFSSVFNEKFILHRPADGSLAQPICFNVNRSVPQKTVVALLLDCSTSMENNFPGYIAILKKFIASLVQDSNFYHATLRITPFATNKKESKEFLLENDSTVLAEIDAFLGQLQADGWTYLHGTLSEELEYFNANHAGSNATILLFTDGKDQPDMSVDKNRITTKLKALTHNINHDTTPPKIFTYALGNDNKHEELKTLAELSGCSHTQLNIIDDFIIILQATSKIGKFRSLARFVQGLTEFSVPVYSQDLNVAVNSINVPGEFSVDGKQYHVRSGGMELIAADDKSAAPVANDLTASKFAEIKKFMAESGVSAAQFARFFAVAGLAPNSSGNSNSDVELTEQKSYSR